MRTILHCDLNSYFASVELLYKPHLRSLPVAVCGDPEMRHGIVLARNPPAKQYGIKAGDVIWQAKQKCPSLIVLPTHEDWYGMYSQIVRKIYSDYTDMVEAFGIDECWLDVSASLGLLGKPLDIANELRERVKKETDGLTISVGISFGKIFAKLGSDMKKPDAVTEIPYDNFKDMVWKLPSGDMLGVGHATAKQLHKYGIDTIGDIARRPVEFYDTVRGKCGVALWRYANGIDNDPVMKDGMTPKIKSIGHGNTGIYDLENNEQVYAFLLELAQDVSHRLKSNGLQAKSIELDVRDNKLLMRQYQSALPFPTQSWYELAKAAYKLFVRNYDWEYPVRSLTVRGISLENENTPTQIDFFTDMSRIEKRNDLENAIEKIRSRYGNGAINVASTLGGTFYQI